MSIARQLFQEFRPLFRMLEEPYARFYGHSRMADPFFNVLNRPAVDIAEKGDRYVLDADLPGIKRENLEVRIGDEGRSVTIEGKVMDNSSGQATQVAQSTTESTSNPVESATQTTAERPYSSNVTFSRTVWLPRPIDADSVSAKLDHGVLSITMNKLRDRAGKSIPID